MAVVHPSQQKPQVVPVGGGGSRFEPGLGSCEAGVGAGTGALLYSSLRISPQV